VGLFLLAMFFLLLAFSTSISALNHHLVAFDGAPCCFKMLLFLKVDMRGDVNIPPPTLLQLEIAVPEIHGSTGFPPIFIVFP
jgi:hypothetical protein